MSKAKSVTAAFLGPYTLKVTKTAKKKGTGTVTSYPSGIYCGSDCQEKYQAGTTVTLTATPDSGISFSGWTPKTICSGTGVCTVVMSAAKTVTATFTGKGAAESEEEKKQ
jgi:hypothetical protein